MAKETQFLRSVCLEADEGQLGLYKSRSLRCGVAYEEVIQGLWEHLNLPLGHQGSLLGEYLF